MSPEMKFVGNGYELTTHLGDKVKLNNYDVQEIKRFFRHDGWETLIEWWIADNEAILNKEAFIQACIDIAEERYQDDRPVDIVDVCEYIYEDWEDE